MHMLLERLTHAVHQVLLAIDQLANTLLLFGHPGTYADETISARAWRQSREGRPARWVWFRRFVDALFIWQDAWLLLREQHTGRLHCQRAYDKEQARMGLPPEYRSVTDKEGP